MTNELLALIAIHFACADAAVERRLTSAEMQYCGGVYNEIKLAFTETDAETFARLSLAEQAELHQRGFLAFYDWRADNPGLVRHLENVARGEAKLGVAG